MAEEEQTTEVAVVPLNQSIVMPAVDANQAVEAWRQYEDLKSKILDKKTDVQVIGSNEFKKKSYWKKLQTFFNLNTEIIKEEKIKGATDDPMDFVYHFTVRTIAPNGRFVDAVGSCASYEKADWKDGEWVTEKKTWSKTATGKSFMKPTGEFEPAQPNTEHNVRSTAYTRAANRSISDLVGGGEVSAEEVDRGHDKEPEDNQPEDKKPTTKPTAKAAPKTEGKEVPANVNVETGEIVDNPPAEAKPDEDPQWIKEAMDSNSISDLEVEELYSLAEEKGFDKDQTNANLMKAFQTSDPKTLNREQYERVMTGLTKAPKK